MVSVVYAESRGAKLKPNLSYLREMDTATLSQKCQTFENSGDERRSSKFSTFFVIDSTFFRRFQAMNDARASFRRLMKYIIPVIIFSGKIDSILFYKFNNYY